MKIVIAIMKIIVPVESIDLGHRSAFLLETKYSRSRRYQAIHILPDYL
jgi:hypothetical protein